jgi:osmotically-inducible protein OsmY
MYPLAGENDLEQRVKLYLAATRRELSRIGVRANGSTVRLTGQVGSFYLRQLALAAAQRVAGVQFVADDIEVALSRREIARQTASSPTGEAGQPETPQPVDLGTMVVDTHPILTWSTR